MRENEDTARNTGVEDEIEKADNDVKWLEEWRDNSESEKEGNAREEQLRYELQLHEAKLKLMLDAKRS